MQEGIPGSALLLLTYRGFASGVQNVVPPLNVLPSTESQCFSGAGSLGLLVAGSTGHLAMAPMRDPKFVPSRSGFNLTLKTVPAPNVAA